MATDAQDLRGRAEEWGDEPVEPWKSHPGDVLVGRIIEIDIRATEYDPRVPVVTVETDTGEVLAVWAFHTVLRNELKKKGKSPPINKPTITVGEDSRKSRLPSTNTPAYFAARAASPLAIMLPASIW